MDGGTLGSIPASTSISIPFKDLITSELSYIGGVLDILALVAVMGTPTFLTMSSGKGWGEA